VSNQPRPALSCEAQLGHVRQVGACWWEMVGASLVDNDSDLGHNTTVVDVGRNSGNGLSVWVHQISGIYA
jgi:hypothetical protein